MLRQKAKAESLKPRIIFLVGPTAIGKSALAIGLARKINAEIISCDSMQIYKGLDILSSKPDKKMCGEVKHHLLDVASPEKEFNVALYRRLALQAIKNIHRRKKIPLFVGGSGLYMSVVIDGIFKEAGADLKIRRRLYEEAENKGINFLYERLRGIDAQAARKIHPNDLKRIVRALEVYQKTGKTISELKKTRKGLSDKYDILIFGLNKDREKLYQDINSRVEEMFEQGLVTEVKKLMPLKLSLTCRQAIGINEIKGYLEGKYGLEEAKELIKRNTRRYAKRQLTWFRKDKRIIWIGAQEGKRTVKKIIEKICRGF